ncbi:MAG: hypothetical protein PVH37_11140 [Desulfobacterales bacterium]
MSLLRRGIFLLLALPVWIQYLPGLYGRKYLGHVLQWHHLAMPGLWGAEWIRQPMRGYALRGIQEATTKRIDTEKS